MKDLNNMNPTILILHGLVGHPDERKWLTAKLESEWYKVLAPNIHKLPTSWNPQRKTKDDLVAALKAYIVNNIDNSWNIAILANSMGTHLAECLVEDEAILARISHYISVAWCGLWVQHGNGEFADFMKLIAWDGSWFFALTNGMKKLMNTNDIQSFITLRYKSFLIKYMLLLYHFLKSTTVESLRNDMIRLGISKTIWIPTSSINEDFITRTLWIMWSMWSNNTWEVNQNIATIALWLPKEGKWTQKDAAFNQTRNKLWKMKDNWVQSMVIGGVNDPMVSIDNIRKMGESLGVEAHMYPNGWHAPHLSPDAERFSFDIIDFLERTKAS